MATIREVAERAGVSIASVSRIMNKDPSYRATAETKERVLAAIAELGYTPAPNYRKRAAKPGIGCISRVTVEHTEDSYYSAILRGAQNFIMKKGYDFEFVLSQFDIVNPESLASLLARPPKGLLLMGDTTAETMRILTSKIKYIVGVDTVQTSIDNICYDHFEAGCRAMRYLLDMGHKKIAFIGANLPGNALNVGRYEAYLRMMKQADLPIDPAWIVDSEWHRGVCHDKTLALMRGKNRPTAILVSSDHMAIAAMSAITSIGISIPDEISVIGISDIEDAKYLSPPLTTIAIPQTAIGEIAADVLLQRMQGDRSLPKRIIVPTELVERNSVGFNRES